MHVPSNLIADIYKHVLQWTERQPGLNNSNLMHYRQPYTIEQGKSFYGSLVVAIMIVVAMGLEVGVHSY